MKKRHSFGGSIGFVLAAAGSAVGLGNIWRFPYLAAKDGGGIFLVVYLVLSVTFGFSLLTTEIAIGRRTRQSPLTAYDHVKKGWRPLGIISCLVPILIMPYYCAIGGWVLKYLIVFISGKGLDAANDGFFTSFISSQYSPVFFTIVFLAATTFVILQGVNKGIEAMSKILMPVLLLLIIVIAVFSLTLTHKDASGTIRTGLQGLKIYMLPDFTGITPRDFLSVVVDAMGQMFYSLSIAMGIMIAYGSYLGDEVDLTKSVIHIEIFDTLIAFLAGVMVIPAVYAFMGREGMSSSGPGLMFISLPKVFASMGSIGRVIGILFFFMVFFAALTSSVSIMEAIVSSFMDEFSLSRNKASWLEFSIAAVVGTIVCLGYNILFFTIKLPNGNEGQILDLLDYISNSMLMPVCSILTCILIGWVVGPSYVTEEISKNGEPVYRKGILTVMIKYIAPVMLSILFLQSMGLLKGL